MFTSEFLKSAKRFHQARLISSIGAAFTEFAIPLILYVKTKDPVHLGAQYALLALARIFAAKFSNRLPLGTTDKNSILTSELLLGIATLLPFALFNSAPIVSSYLLVICSATLTTLQAAYVESFVGNVSTIEEKTDSARSWLLAKIENGKHIGMLFGYLLAYFVTVGLSYRYAFLIDSLTFFGSALIMWTIPRTGRRVRREEKQKPIIKLMFSDSLKRLTLTQAIISLALFFYNGTFIFVLKDTFQAPDSIITALFITQYIGYMAGSFVPTWWIKRFKTHIPDRTMVFINSLIVLAFVGYSISWNYYVFLASNIFLSFVLAISVPGVSTFFQRMTKPEDLRVVGASRQVIRCITAAVGAACSSLLLKVLDHHFIYSVATLAVVLASYFFYSHYRKFFSGKKRISLRSAELDLGIDGLSPEVAPLKTKNASNPPLDGLK